MARTQSCAAMDWVERFLMVLMLVGMLGAAVGIASIILL